MPVPNRPARLFALAAAVTLALGGCTTSDSVGYALVAPGKYMLYTCPELVQVHIGIVARQRELEGLMAKAGQDAGGRFVSTIAYESDYASMKGQMRVLQQEAQAKNCKLPDANLVAAAPKPALKPASRPATKPAPKPASDRR